MLLSLGKENMNRVSMDNDKGEGGYPFNAGGGDGIWVSGLDNHTGGNGLLYSTLPSIIEHS